MKRFFDDHPVGTLLNAVEAEDGEPQEFSQPAILNPNGAPATFVNVYRVERCYGGPEEGGWWYDTGEPVGSVVVQGSVETHVVRTRLEREYPFTRARYSVLGGEDYSVRVEDHPAVAWPAQRPHYC